MSKKSGRISYEFFLSSPDQLQLIAADGGAVLSARRVKVVNYIVTVTCIDPNHADPATRQESRFASEAAKEIAAIQAWDKIEKAGWEMITDLGRGEFFLGWRCPACAANKRDRKKGNETTEKHETGKE